MTFVLLIRPNLPLVVNSNDKPEEGKIPRKPFGFEAALPGQLKGWMTEEKKMRGDDTSQHKRINCPSKYLGCGYNRTEVYITSGWHETKNRWWCVWATWARACWPSEFLFGMCWGGDVRTAVEQFDLITCDFTSYYCILCMLQLEHMHQQTLFTTLCAFLSLRPCNLKLNLMHFFKQQKYTPDCSCDKVTCFVDDSLHARNAAFMKGHNCQANTHMTDPQCTTRDR